MYSQAQTPEVEVTYNEGTDQDTVEKIKVYQEHLQGIATAYANAGFSTSSFSSKSLLELLKNPEFYLANQKRVQQAAGQQIDSITEVVQKVKAFLDWSNCPITRAKFNEAWVGIQIHN